MIIKRFFKEKLPILAKLLELNPEIFLRDIKLFRNIKNILWEEFEDLEICDEDSDKWNEFIDRVNDFE